MAVNVEMWQKLVKEEFFKSNAFLSTMKNADEYVVGGSSVHIPQSGGHSDAEKNRATVPAAAVKRTDTVITYPLDEYTSTPRLITNIDQVELSYDKMNSVINEDTSYLFELAGDNILYDVSKDVLAASKIPTSGANAPASAPSATGDRKILTAADLRTARKMLNKQNIPKQGRFINLSSEMFDQLMSDDKLWDTYQKTLNQREGELGRLFGFQILERSSVLVSDNAQTIKAPNAAAATTDADTALFYQSNAVERALGEVKMFWKQGDPNSYGDIISFLLRAGSRASRADKLGYGVIYRAA